jgi:hypothetical protein
VNNTSDQKHRVFTVDFLSTKYPNPWILVCPAKSFNASKTPILQNTLSGKYCEIKAVLKLLYLQLYIGNHGSPWSFNENRANPPVGHARVGDQNTITKLN